MSSRVELMAPDGWMMRWGVGATSVLLGAALLGIFIQTGVINVSSTDVGLYRWWGEAIAGGALPYRQIPIEYPPGAVPLFVIPAMVSASFSTYWIAFGTGIGLAGAIGIVLAARVGVIVGRPSRAWMLRTIGSGAMIGALASVAVARFDLVPASLMIVGLFAVASNRLTYAGVFLGAGIAVKVFPAVVVPIVIGHIVKRAGWRSVPAFTVPLLAVVALAFLPFVIFAADGIQHSFSVQLSRPLEIESIGASVLLIARATALMTWPPQPSYFNLDFAAADVASVATTAIGAAVLCYVWVTHARSDGSTRGLLWASFASVGAFVVFAKVLSPQFLLWLIVLIPALRGSRATLAAALLGVATVLTALYFPGWFSAVGTTLDAEWVSVIVLRNGLLVAMLVLALREIGRRMPSSPR